MHDDRSRDDDGLDGLDDADEGAESFPWLYTAVDLFTQCVMFMALIATFGSSILASPPKKADPKKTLALPKTLSKIDRDRKLLEALLASAAGKNLTLRKDQGRLALLLRDRIFFESGEAALRSEAQETIQKVGQLLSKMECEIWVAGFTDDVPIHTAQYTSNWVLATARAINVLKILQGSGIAPRRLAAAGYGKYHPRYPNNSKKNRAANRRVEISLVYK
ncbi:MAG: OmpA family protein [Deltaproteobacteria bacterium]|nr:OmpA family protein [Deltaproteobacteria bacterium]